MEPGAVNDALSLIARVTALGKRATHVQFEEALLAARQEILKYKEINISLREELLSLQNQSKFTIAKGHAWLVNADDPEGPKYCTSCQSADSRITPLIDTRDGAFYCRICQVSYKD